MVLKADLSQMKIDTLKFGILFSCKMNVVLVAERIAIRFLANCQQKVLILVLA